MLSYSKEIFNCHLNIIYNMYDHNEKKETLLYTLDIILKWKNVKFGKEKLCCKQNFYPFRSLTNLLIYGSLSAYFEESNSVR